MKFNIAITSDRKGVRHAAVSSDFCPLLTVFPIPEGLSDAEAEAMAKAQHIIESELFLEKTQDASESD